MEKVKKYTKKREIYKHKFYCDKCNEFIMESIEEDDGYYDEPDYLEEKIYINEDEYLEDEEDGWYEYNKCLCPKCYKVEKQKIIEELKKIGFNKED